MHFYEQVIRQGLSDHLQDSILVACGTGGDAKILRSIGFTNVTITNLDKDRTDGIAPFTWKREDAEALSFPDGSFDWVLVDAGLHHCASPHKAFTEMYRVCRKGALVLEARDSLVMRLAVKLGLVPEWEQIAVALTGAGLRAGPIPNYIYRWTEREVWKTLESAYPNHAHRLRFFYGMRVPNYRLSMLSPPKRVATLALSYALKAFNLVARRQGNHLGWIAYKTGQLKPWMLPDGLHMRPDYDIGMDPRKYSGYRE